jgi:hypothetical protein
MKSERIKEILREQLKEVEQRNRELKQSRAFEQRSRSGDP